MWVTSATATALTPTAIALGNFDGVHLGHRIAIEPIIRYSPHSYPTVVTFDPHPQEFFTGNRKPLLTPLEEKVQQLERLGVRQLMLLPFNRELAALSPQAFVSQVLVEQLGAKFISVGADFCFGAKRAGTAADLRAIAGTYGVEVEIAPLHHSCDEGNEIRIGSSAIRQALKEGKLALANRWLGRPYSLTGPVVTGKQLGRTLGFPTANLRVPPNKLLPHYGVYRVKVLLPNGTSAIGVANIGCRPTVDGSAAPSVEIHLLDWSGDLYHQILTVELQQFLRPEQKFASLDALKAQITADCQAARNFNF